ncbi:unannotated protein [freshwater metagenome]|jgi:hypothetical protein|uniref:Unannotated protein n=1 Tax=freshwater metagenome TaxID=449393 RepID=A0A6J6J8I5_9ZZZZ|nr:hypothetical protein [Actinomycetota bacterium]MSZ28329.1 hypothetical protein [Actinomycetota bacterium]
MRPPKNSFSARLPLAITLIIASFASVIFITSVANKGADYWVVRGSVISGHVITSNDLETVHMNLSKSSALYIDKNFNPIGLIALRTLQDSEVISTSDLGSDIQGQSTSAVPLSVRSVDIAQGLTLGEGVDIYWVSDSNNGEEVVEPVLVLAGAALLSLENTGNSFSGDVGLSIAVEQTQVLRVLSATSVGRLVVIASHV